MQMPVKCSFFKVVLAALMLVAVLQLIYLSLLSGLHGRQQKFRFLELFEARKVEPAHHRLDQVKKSRLKLSLASGGVLDSSGQYRLYKNLLKAGDDAANNDGLQMGQWAAAAPSPPREDLVLATHTTLNNLHHLQELLARWRGPVSVALFAPSPEEVRFTTMMIYVLSTLCAPVNELVSFHLVCHSGDLAIFPELADRGEFARLKSCDDVFRKLADTGIKLRNYDIGANASYPNNLLRNVARGVAGSHYVLVIDVDMLPSEGLRLAFLSLMAGRPSIPEGEHTVYVVPSFEIRHTRRIPGAKAELLQLYQVGEIRPFYEELCQRCQAPTNYSQWLNLPTGDEMQVVYSVEWKDPWEPFYISVSSVPPFDERFKQYGFNRISQACELHVAGYTFLVVNNAFLVHKGFKVSGEFHSKKDAENQHNKLLFRQFKQELKMKYPSSGLRC
ncbi:beta-1,4-glucuronyltransferase 1 [Ambystoma mexicanum]|uniref:beta-1,4-glucuronyltransferase 1 n=1 Tax=Ambystoma mexicanum TaxID=8296 RepID=UPI0037E70053